MGRRTPGVGRARTFKRDAGPVRLRTGSWGSGGVRVSLEQGLVVLAAVAPGPASRCSPGHGNNLSASCREAALREWELLRACDSRWIWSWVGRGELGSTGCANEPRFHFSRPAAGALGFHVGFSFRHLLRLQVADLLEGLASARDDRVSRSPGLSVFLAGHGCRAFHG